MLEIVTVESESQTSALDAAALASQLAIIGLDDVISQIARAVTHGGDRFALPDAEQVKVVAGWNHALALHRRNGSEIGRALEEAERAWQHEQSEENAQRIAELKAIQGQRIDMEQA